ncbi:MAG: hypothetical protein M3Q07_25565 [Pseudobdellovibrionaceae bacterium]|nr:hypothetical protein [Pseudobdellovibrionaceae bacterium]
MNTQWSRCLIWLFGCLLLISGQAFADGYSKGLDAFRDGEYPKAYKILSGVVKKAKDKSDKAEAMALMGAAAAKMGKKSKAESLFNKALKLDPDVSLSKDAVKDKGVRKLFTKAKKGGSGDEGDDAFEDDKSEKSASKSSDGGGMSYKGFIPLGLGFLFNGEVSKGLIYGGAQAAGLVGFIYYNGEISKANADADAIGQDALARQQANQALDEETLAFLDQNEAFVKEAQNNQKLMVAILGAGYGLSVLDGLFFGGSSKKARSKKRADILLKNPGESLVDTTRTTLDEMEETEEAPRLWDMKLHLLPRHDPALMLSINRSF